MKKIIYDYKIAKRNKIINEYLEEMASNGKTIFRRNEIRDFFFNKSRVLKMKSYSFHKFLRYLEEKKFLKKIVLSDIKNIPKTYYRSKFFEYKNNFEKIIELSNVIYKKGYFSYYTAVYLNGLTEQIPKIIYIKSEYKKNTYLEDNDLTNELIAKAFSKEKKQSKICFKKFGYSVRHIHGKYSENIGVSKRKLGELTINVSDLERTLIDITIRPDYAGGLYSVLNAFKAAKEFGISINKIIFYLNRINYIYPYHQAIGFLLEYAGFNTQMVDKLKKLGIEYNFFLVHNPDNKDEKNIIFCKKWKIYVPKILFDGIENNIC